VRYRLCFIASGAAIKIYSVQSCKLVSTLAVPSRTTPAEGALKKAARDVSSLFVSPSNNLQLISTTYDGVVCLWDYLDGTVLRVLEMTAPIQLAAISRSRPNDFFMCLQSGKGKQDSTIVRIPISLEPKDAQRKLGTAKNPVALAVSNDGKYMVVLGSVEITVVLIEQAMAHKPTSPDEFTVTFEGSSNPETVWTELAVHPLENYFVTGENTGKIKFWYILREDRLKSIQEDLRRRKHKNTALAVPPTCTAVVHWHAHAVSALRFTGNGAYLMSGGEEGVVVMWSMAASAMHKDFVPRLGGPIVSLSHTNYYEMQQELVARLSDGSIVFISSGTLEITRIISGLKSGKQFWHISRLRQLANVLVSP
jgi:NET1-associated nuclear protein 1 (U3 small nucleolar RNA-associated protein 17)